MDIVLMLHSFVRLVLLVLAVVGIVKTAINLVGKRESAGADRLLASAFLGLYDVQVLLGLLIIFLGGLTNAAHPIIMFIGAVIAHALQAMSRRAQGMHTQLVRLGLYAIPFAIIVIGLAVINRLLV